MRSARKVNLLIAGAQKAGTTALHRFLGQHPAVFMSGKKELHYFDHRAKWATRMGARRIYEGHFAGASDQRRAMAAEDRRFLNAFFHDDVRALSAIIGRDLSVWQTEASHYV